MLPIEIQQKIIQGMKILNDCNFEIIRSKVGIKILEDAVIDSGYPDIIDINLYQIVARIGYYYAKTYNYEKSVYWLKSLVNTNFDYGKSWETFLKISLPIMPDSLESEKKYWSQLDENLNYLLDNSSNINLNNTLIMDFSFTMLIINLIQYRF